LHALKQSLIHCFSCSGLCKISESGQMLKLYELRNQFPYIYLSLLNDSTRSILGITRFLYSKTGRIFCPVLIPLKPTVFPEGLAASQLIEPCSILRGIILWGFFIPNLVIRQGVYKPTERAQRSGAEVG